MISIHADAYTEARVASGKTGYYSGREMQELRLAQIADEIADAEHRIAELENEATNLELEMED